MDTRKREPIQLDDLLSDPLMRRNMPPHFRRDLFIYQMRDPALTGIDLDDLLSLESEELAEKILTGGLSWGTGGMEVNEAAGAGINTGDGASGAASPGSPEADTRGGVSILLDGLAAEAKIVLSQTPNGSPSPDAEDIHRALRDAGIVEGIREAFIDRLVQRPVYGRKFRIAEGKLPVNGQDGRVIFHFNPEFDLKPKINEDGTADYRNLDYAKNVKKGELLCEIIPPTPGSDGISVRGEVLPGKTGKPADIVCGANTVLSGDGTEIRAACDGQVHLKNNKVMVSRVLSVENVDAKTGNILFVGSIQVRGDIAPGFMVRAGGDITVKGIVENAVLVSGGNIVLCSGMKGQEKGVLDAGEDIRAYFIENAKVSAKGNIYADVILNSNVKCEGRISVSGRNGTLVGGMCFAQAIYAVKLGNEANAPTYVAAREMNPSDMHQEQMALKVAQYRHISEHLAQLIEISAQEQDETIYQISLCRMLYVKILLDREVENWQRDESHPRRQQVIVARETLYPNVTMEISGTVYKSREKRSAAALRKAGGKLYFDPARYY